MLRSAVARRGPLRGLVSHGSVRCQGRPEGHQREMRTEAMPAKKGPADVPYRLGLTGSIGMGKTTIGGMFRDLKVPVLDSDASVHELYVQGGAAVPLVQELFPSAVVDGAVDRKILSAIVLGKPAGGGEQSADSTGVHKLAQLEAAVHPLVAEARDHFLQQSKSEGHELVVLDIPLLFEKDLLGAVDAVLVVTAPEEVQRRRCLAREGMTEDKLAAILAKQVPDAEKRRRADVVIDTDKDENFTRIEVAEIVHRIVSEQQAAGKV